MEQSTSYSGIISKTSSYVKSLPSGKVTSYLLSNSVNPSRNMSYVTNIFILDLFVIQKAKIQINWQLIPKFVTNIYLLWY